MVKFEVDPDKAIEALTYLLSKQEKVNQYNALKALFEADKIHLNEYARPVTGDTYIKMDFGTVPSVVYNLIKGDSYTLASLNLDELPFERIGLHDLKANRAPRLEFLSETDIEALDAGAAKYFGLSFTEVKNLNHEERAWTESILNQPIDFSLMIENQEVREYLEDAPGTLAI